VVEVVVGEEPEVLEEGGIYIISVLSHSRLSRFARIYLALDSRWTGCTSACFGGSGRCSLREIIWCESLPLSILRFGT
jgi:hypothetical protein